MYTRFNHTAVFFRVKFIVSTHNTSKFIFGRQKDFECITKLMHSARLQAYLLHLNFLVKSCEIVLPPLPNPDPICLYGHDLPAICPLLYRLAKIEIKYIL